jgi:hypothetical protein
MVKNKRERDKQKREKKQVPQTACKKTANQIPPTRPERETETRERDRNKREREKQIPQTASPENF